MANKSRVYTLGGASALAAPPWFDVANRVSADVALPGGIPPVVSNGALMPIPVGVNLIFPMLIYTFGLTSPGGSANQVVQWLVVERDSTGLLNIYSMGGDGSPGDLGTAAPIASGADNVQGRIVSGTVNAGVARQVIMLGPSLAVPAPPPPP